MDAIIGGYLPEGGEDHTEWSSLGEKAGAWINLQWANPVAASSVVLYDRINLDVCDSNPQKHRHERHQGQIPLGSSCS